MNRLNGDALNGAAKRKATPKRVRRTGRKATRYARGLAAGVGCVGVLGLSVVHCTESIELLTGSHWALAGLLAVGIDAGMVASELAVIASHGTRSQGKDKPWALGSTAAAVLLSVLLNAGAHWKGQNGSGDGGLQGLQSALLFIRLRAEMCRWACS
jgi:hypothetical protein